MENRQEVVVKIREMIEKYEELKRKHQEKAQTRAKLLISLQIKEEIKRKMQKTSEDNEHSINMMHENKQEKEEQR